MAREVSTWSKDPRSKCGSVIAKGNEELAYGYNGFPECIEDKPEWYEDRETKLKLVIHAEKNARNKVKDKDSLLGATIYNYPYPPCGECAKEIASWGITRVVAPKSDRKEFQEAAEFVFAHCKDGRITFHWCDLEEIDA